MHWLAGFSLLIAVAASVEDLWRRRVSNVIALTAFVGGLTGQSILRGLEGTWDSLLGTLIGFAVFLVFFLLGGMGGGDIKLMAGFGAIVGSHQIFLAAIMAALVGGVMALLYLLVQKVRRLVKGADASAGALRKEAIPYAPAIGLGVLMSFLSEGSLWTSVS